MRRWYAAPTISAKKFVVGRWQEESQKLAANIGLAGNAITRISNSGVRPPLDLGIFSHFLFLQNFIPVILFGLAGAWFGHLWSLAVEEQFYLIAPLVVRFTTERYLKWILGVAVMAVPLLRIFLLRVLHVSNPQITVLVICRADALAIGMLTAALTRGETPLLSIERNIKTLFVFLGILLCGVVVLWKFSPQASTFGMQSIGYT
jgi:peptidoglycan/LPS O-acetylase OafA/YrhL